MKAILKKKKEWGFVLDDIPVPDLRKREALVRVHSAAICGSDLKLSKWTPWCKKVVKSLRFIPGNECAGEAVSTESAVSSLKVEDKVAVETHIPCGICWQCRHYRPQWYAQSIKNYLYKGA